VPWPFARLAELWGGLGVVAATIGEFRAALRQAWQEPRFTLIEMARIHRDAMAVPGAVGTALPRARNAPAAASPASR